MELFCNKLRVIIKKLKYETKIDSLKFKFYIIKKYFRKINRFFLNCKNIFIIIILIC
jgi:hypothetical protein